MAKTIAWCHGHDSGRVKSAHRLGSQYAAAEANTFRTFAMVCTHSDGSGHVAVIRDGQVIHSFEYGPE